MGTNFYWKKEGFEVFNQHQPLPSETIDPRVHIGKKIARKTDAKSGFLYAQKPECVLDVCKTYPDTKVAFDELGYEYTGHELTHILNDCVVLPQIGVRFS